MIVAVRLVYPLEVADDMSNTDRFKRDRRGDGGFMEALMAMMVVTVAVALLALSFSITSHDLREQGDGTELKEGGTRLLNTMENDVSVWREGMLVWTSMQARASTPYPLPDVLNGYCLEIIDIGDGSSSVTIENSTLHSDRSPMVLKHACNVVRTDGSIGPGLIVLEVW